MGKAANSSETIHNLHQELKSIVKPNKVPQNDTRKLCKFFLVLNYLRQFLASFYEASSGFAMILGLKWKMWIHPLLLAALHVKGLLTN